MDKRPERVTESEQGWTYSLIFDRHFCIQLASASTLKEDVVSGLDLLILRELIGGIYFGEPRGIEGEPGQRVGFNTDRYSESEIERIGRIAFDAAMARDKALLGRQGECSSHRAVAVVERLGKYPEVELSHMYVDNAAMQLVP